MGGAIVCLAVGIACIVIGISNMKGNISTLHSYHRNNVSEEDILPFGRAIGRGTIISGIAVMIYGIFTGVALMTGNEIFTLIGGGVMIAGLAVGIGIALYAIKKYNGGIMR